MPGTVIGKKMNLGFIGKVSRDGDAVIVNRIVSNDEASTPINFGSAVFLNDDNTVRNFKTGDTVNKFVGIAVATVIHTGILIFLRFAFFFPAKFVNNLFKFHLTTALEKNYIVL